MLGVSRRKPGRYRSLGLQVPQRGEQNRLFHHHVLLQPVGRRRHPRVPAGDGRLPVPVCVAHRGRVWADVSKRLLTSRLQAF